MKRAVSCSVMVGNTTLPFAFAYLHGEGKTFRGENIYREN